MYITPTWGDFQARLLDNQEGANTDRYVFGKALREMFPAPTIFGIATTPTVEISTLESRPTGGGGDVHRRVGQSSHFFDEVCLYQVPGIL